MTLARFCPLILMFGFAIQFVQSAEKTYHEPHVTSHPEQPANEQTTGFDIDRSELESAAWKAAIQTAQSHQEGRGYYSLMRVIVKDGPDGEIIKADATKLKKLAEQYEGGGGQYFQLRSGQFLFFEHINTNRRLNNFDPVRFGSVSLGQIEVYVETPKPGVLNVVGDLILEPTPEDRFGTLQLQMNSGSCRRLNLTCKYTPGPNLRQYNLEEGGLFEQALPPGEYQLNLPGLDEDNDRWIVTIRSQETTKVEIDEQGKLVANLKEIKPGLPRPIKNMSRQPHHAVTPTSQPDGQLADEKPHFEIDHSQLETDVWKEAIRKAKQFQQGKMQVSVMRVFLKEGPMDEIIQAQAGKLNELTERNAGGGGTFFMVQSGGFFIVEHINSTQRINNRDPVQIASLSHGVSKLWAEVPQWGELNVIGDVILDTLPEEVYGTLQMHVSAIRGNRFQLGSVVTGGPYGKIYQLDQEGNYELPLPEGKYKLLMPDFDLRRSRWDVQIHAGKTTLVEFDENEQIDADAKDVQLSTQ